MAVPYFPCINIILFSCIGEILKYSGYIGLSGFALQSNSSNCLVLIHLENLVIKKKRPFGVVTMSLSYLSTTQKVAFQCSHLTVSQIVSIDHLQSIIILKSYTFCSVLGRATARQPNVSAGLHNYFYNA